MSKRCTVVCDTPAGVFDCELELPDGATIAMALVAARQVLGDMAADWEQGTTGIYGRVYARDHVPGPGDRIELYRPLHADPRLRRRAQVKQARSRRR